MNRGFSKVVGKTPAIADKDIGFILKNTGTTLLSSVGGASWSAVRYLYPRRTGDPGGTAKPDAGRALSDVPRWRGRRNQSRESRNLAIKPCVMCGCRWWNRYVKSSEQNLSVPAALEAARASPNPLHKVRLRCKPAKAAPVISVNAVSVTRIPARPRR